MFHCLYPSQNSHARARMPSPSSHVQHHPIRAVPFHCSSAMFSLKKHVLTAPKSWQKIATYTSFTPKSTPGPPKLPAEDQLEFERLQKIAASQAAIEEYNDKLVGQGKKPVTKLPSTTDIGNFPSYFATIPEFEGDVNPKSGEVNGPKQDPLRHGDYSFNGKVTDF